MPPSPILGGFSQSRSPNQADNQAQNLFLEITETKDGKSPGYLQMTPGLSLLTTVGNGPIRTGTSLVGANLFVVSGSSLYQITPALVATLVGDLATSAGPVSMITNGNQLVVFDGVNGYLTTNNIVAAGGGVTLTGGNIYLPGVLYVVGDTITLEVANGSGGVQDATAILTVTGTGDGFTGGTISNGGTGYAVDDDITLVATNGTQNMPAILQVTSVNGSGAVTGFTIPNQGVFLASNLPTAFTQASSSGAGTGFTVTALSYDQSGQVLSFTVTSGGAFSSPPTGLIQASTSGSGSGFGLAGGLTFAPGPMLLPVSLPFTGAPLSATYQDGYGLVSVAETQTFYQSDLNDLSIWETLNFSSADATPDNIVSLIDLQRQIFIHKQYHFEVWVNVGVAGFTFQRLQGVFGEFGSAATFSMTKAGESLIWLAQNDQGVRFVMQLSGYEPRKISTAALEGKLAQYATVSDAIAYVYSQSGHQFYVLTFPSEDVTWCCDLSATRLAGVPEWHNRSAWDQTGFHRHWSNSYANFYNTAQPGHPNVVGDFVSGNLYTLSLTQLTDNGTPRRALRTWRAVAQQPKTPQRYSCLTIEMETGVDVPANPAPPVTDNPQVILRWSDDGGHNWSSEKFMSVGALGQTSKRVLFYRLGSTRRATGLDRIFELSWVDQFKVAITGAFVD